MVADTHMPGKLGQAKQWSEQCVNRVCKKGVRSRIYVSRGFGELASVGSAIAAAVVVDSLLKEPYGGLKSWVAKNAVEPHLAFYDNVLSYAKSLDPPHEREERHALSEPEQARKISDLLADQFGVKFAASVYGQYKTQDYFTRMFNAPVSKKHNLISIGVDRGVQIGSMIALNTAFADQAVGMQNMMIKVLRNSGMDEEKAEDWAKYGINFVLPNFLAYGASAELMTHFCKRGVRV